MEFTFQIESTGIPDPRVEDLDDLYEAIVGRTHVLGPALAGDLTSGAVSLIVTIEGLADERDAAAYAVQVLADALVATGRATAVARVDRALALA